MASRKLLEGVFKKLLKKKKNQGGGEEEGCKLHI